ncbi:BGL1A [Symbiodinium natans]|uniref:beta-glucosidase n=1 Tax=Symbiodinium natans TaxID=878477 RepID=A0A812KS12_9DINO|nr:BGL1A [Symbiodinium natans]
MRVTVSSTADNCEGWVLELEVSQKTTVAALKKLLAGPPHFLGVVASTKVLFRDNGVLTTLFDKEIVHSHVTLLNVNDDRVLPFPADFLWGAATAAYQIEGAADKEGRSPSIWDTFCSIPGKVHNGDSGAHACEHYYRYADDVKLMKDLGLKAYRFSISWSRLLPAGTGKPNHRAVDFYQSLLSELCSSGITPVVTLYHWDLPQCLEDKYSGWLSREVIDDFEYYASVCFDCFGSEVKHWITLNEPWCACALGYGSGEHAPGRSQDPGKEPYLAAHHMLLAHARAVKCYRDQYQNTQGGNIGITLNMDWKEPLGDNAADQAAQRRALDWQLGWFADPIYKGAYPATMRERCGDRLPEFSDNEVELLKGSSDFFGLNHYSTDFVSPGEDGPPATPNFFADQDVKNISDPRWQRTDMGWDIVPWGFEKLLCWIQKEYAPAGGILVTENGCAIRENTEAEALQDSTRVEYLQGYLAQLHKAMANGAAIKGYLVWSLLDNFEWSFGYAKRFGIVRVDFVTQQRTPKASAHLISSLCKGEKLRVPSRIHVSSEFVPFHGRGKEPEAEPKKAGPTLSKADAKRMLEEFIARYQDDHFQTKMVSCFQQFLIHNDEMRLLKARRSLCMPIQAEIIPKYGFEPTARGVSRVQATLSAPTLTEDPEIQQMNHFVVYLTGDLPKSKAAEGATV